MSVTYDVRRHPWNTDFMWTDRDRAGSVLEADQIRSFDEHGFVVVEDGPDPPVRTGRRGSSASR